VFTWDCRETCSSCESGRDPYCLNFFLHNPHGARPDSGTTLRKGHQIVHGSFFRQSSIAAFALARERSVVKVRDDSPHAGGVSKAVAGPCFQAILRLL